MQLMSVSDSDDLAAKNSMPSCTGEGVEGEGVEGEEVRGEGVV